MDRKFKKVVLGLLVHVTPSIFSLAFLGEKLQFTNHIFVSRSTEIIQHQILIQTLYFFTRLPTRQDGVENRDKVYSFSFFALRFRAGIQFIVFSLLPVFSIALLSHFLQQTLLQFFRHEEFFICCCLMADVFLLLCCYGLSRRHFNLFVFPASKVLLFLCSLMVDVIHCIFITFDTTEKKIYIFICSLARETYQSVCCLKANVFIALFLFFLYNSISLFFCRHLVSYLFVPYDWSLSYYFYSFW